MAEGELPAAVLDAEVALLAGMGIDFKTGIELGHQVTLEGLRRGFDAILLTVGELAEGDGGKLGVPLAGAVLKADPSTCRRQSARVFLPPGPASSLSSNWSGPWPRAGPPPSASTAFCAASRRAAPRSRFPASWAGWSRANCGNSCAPPARNTAWRRATAAPGSTAARRVREAARCLHCDCRSSGNCLLQHYAQVYGADASRFRAERRPFSQQLQPGGVIFEPGKCIVCGICVKLTEMAAEPLGLTFVGRGFDMRVAAPFDRTIEEGLGAVAEECVRHCPTGALAFADKPSGASAPTPAKE